jgi:4-diphosphocytidyl-2-C-methyl-D-erythritol kinase
LTQITVKAFAKINLTLRVLGVREDGYHDLRTTFQTVALHDTVTFHPVRGEFSIECDDPACPADRTNLVWRAADAVWRASGRRGRPTDVHVRIVKRIPVQAGLGGGSSDAAAAIRVLTRLWRVNLAPARLRAIAATLGADVPFFLEGGAALGLDRGDLLFPLVDPPAAWVALVIPAFGVSTGEAYSWWDSTNGLRRESPTRRGWQGRGRQAGLAFVGGLPADELRNDLEPAVSARHPEIARFVRALRNCGAYHAAMSGSGSATFGLFASRTAAEKTRRLVKGAGARVLITRTLNRRAYQAATRPR